MNEMLGTINASHFYFHGPNSLRCTKILSQHHLFYVFYLVFFLPYKNTFMDDYDGIYNCSGLTYDRMKYLTFLICYFYGD
jgi:hypothetical protein